MYLDPEEAWTLLDVLIHLGRMHAFASLVAPERASPQVQALTPTQEAEQWGRMQGVLDTTDTQRITEYEHGSEQGQIPLWTGYTIGYNIMRAFLESNPEVGVEDWMTMSAEEILARSGYNPGP